VSWKYYKKFLLDWRYIKENHRNDDGLQNSLSMYRLQFHQQIIRALKGVLFRCVGYLWAERTNFQHFLNYGE